MIECLTGPDSLALPRPNAFVAMLAGKCVGAYDDVF